MIQQMICRRVGDTWQVLSASAGARDGALAEALLALCAGLGGEPLDAPLFVKARLDDGTAAMMADVTGMAHIYYVPEADYVKGMGVPVRLFRPDNRAMDLPELTGRSLAMQHDPTGALRRLFPVQAGLSRLIEGLVDMAIYGGGAGVCVLAPGQPFQVSGDAYAAMEWLLPMLPDWAGRVNYTSPGRVGDVPLFFAAEELNDRQALLRDGWAIIDAERGAVSCLRFWCQAPSAEAADLALALLRGENAATAQAARRLRQQAEIMRQDALNKPIETVVEPVSGEQLTASSVAAVQAAPQADDHELARARLEEVLTQAEEAARANERRQWQAEAERRALESVLIDDLRKTAVKPADMGTLSPEDAAERLLHEAAHDADTPSTQRQLKADLAMSACLTRSEKLRFMAAFARGVGEWPAESDDQRAYAARWLLSVMHAGEIMSPRTMLDVINGAEPGRQAVMCVETLLAHQDDTLSQRDRLLMDEWRLNQLVMAGNVRRVEPGLRLIYSMTAAQRQAVRDFMADLAAACAPHVTPDGGLLHQCAICAMLADARFTDDNRLVFQRFTLERCRPLMTGDAPWNALWACFDTARATAAWDWNYA